MKSYQVWAVIGVLALIVTAWMTRYEVEWQGSTAYVTDRWVGTASICGQGRCVQMFPPRNVAP